MTKDSTVYPMPGGVENYDETIMDVVNHVDAESPIKSDLIEYILDIGGMESPDSAQRRLSFLQQAEILQQDVDQYQVGSNGFNLLSASDSQSKLFDILHKNFIGFETLLRLIEYEEITELDRLHEKLCSNFDVNWEEAHQTNWRLNYLRSLGYVELSDDGEYETTELGSDLIRDRVPPKRFAPPPSPQSLMTELREQSAIEYDFYWVRTPERLGEFTEYIKIPEGDGSIRPNTIGPGDIIFRYVDGSVVGYASLEEPGMTTTDDGTDIFRAKIHHREFDREVPLNELLAELTAKVAESHDSLEDIQEYPFDQSGLRDCMVGDLPVEAALHILEQGNQYQSYADLDIERTIPTNELLDREEIDLYFSDSQFSRIQNEIQEALSSGEHVIFVGPPGTGKSKLATHVAETICGPEGYAMATATANWSTFDTVGGYQPDRESHLEFIPGTFLSRFQDDDGMPENEWLIIDEINRADIDKAFGSFFSALAGDTVTTSFKSNNEEEITIIGDSDLSHEVKPNHYFIPDSWRILATMNTHDKMTLYDLSYAFMRRFAFVNVPAPDTEQISPELIESYVNTWPGIRCDSSDERAETATEDDTTADETPETILDEMTHENQSDMLTLSESQIEAISMFWETFQKHRAIGPAIVQNVATAVARQPSSQTDLASPIKMYVLPQLGDLPEPTQVEALNALLEESDLPINREHLRAFSIDYFGIDEDKLKTN